MEGEIHLMDQTVGPRRCGSPCRGVDTDETLCLFGSARCVFHLRLRSQPHDYVVVTMVEVKLRRQKAPQQKQPASGDPVTDLQPLVGEAEK